MLNPLGVLYLSNSQRSSVHNHQYRGDRHPSNQPAELAVPYHTAYFQHGRAKHQHTASHCVRRCRLPCISVVFEQALRKWHATSCKPLCADKPRSNRYSSADVPAIEQKGYCMGLAKKRRKCSGHDGEGTEWEASGQRSFLRLVLIMEQCIDRLQAPASFQLPAAPTAAAPTRPVTAAAKPSHPDLITRYNLSSRLNQPDEPTEDKSKAKAWSADRNERQSNLQRKREEMILAARRKMEEKERASASGTAA